MKNGLLRFFIVISSVAVIFAGCVKHSDDPSIPVYGMNAYVGQWKGLFPTTTRDNNGSTEIRLSLVTFNNNTALTGFLNTPSGILILDQQIFFGDVFTFSIRNNSFDNPNCQMWNITGSAYLITVSNMGLMYGGTFCGEHPVNISGTMTQSSKFPDTTILLTMAGVGHKLVYDITESPDITYQLTTETQKDFGNGVYRILATRNNGQQPSSEIYYRYISPVEWGQLPGNDSIPSHMQVNYRIDAKVGIRYITVTSTDSIIITVKSLSENVTVPAGTFRCIKMTKEYKGLTPAAFSGFFETWFSNNFGMIKTLQYDGDSLLMTEVLKEKNF